jgi:copper(I)-binding protein
MNVSKICTARRKADRAVSPPKMSAGLREWCVVHIEHNAWREKKVLNTVTAMGVVMLLLGGSPLGAHATGSRDAQASVSPRIARLPIVSDAWARATVPGQSVGAAYMKINSIAPTALVSVESDVSKFVQVHSMAHQNGVMQMRKLDKLDIAAGQRVELAPGGAHLMLIGLKSPLKAGETLQLTMTFSNSAGVKTTVPVSVPIRPMGQ